MTDAVTTEVFANLFKAIVDEMAWVVLRSSHTTFVKETQDFAVALVTEAGETFASPYGSGATTMIGMPMHAGTRAFTQWEPGDVLVTNDPYSSGGMVMHLNDLYVFRPIFADGALLCFAWAFIHCTDVGGYAPGSIDMQNGEVFQEGLRLRPVKLFRRGEINQEVWDIFADNCRIPALNWGDLTACLAALAKAEQRMQRLAQRYGIDAVRGAITATIDRTERITRDVLRRIPAGEYRFIDYFEDDYISDLPVRLALKLTARGDGTVELDFTGSDPQVRAALNLPTGSMRHHPFLSFGLTSFVVTQSEAIHINAGIIRCIDLVLPEASVVNSRFPASCGMRITTAMRIHDMVLGALAQALPGTRAGRRRQYTCYYLYLDVGTWHAGSRGGCQSGARGVRRRSGSRWDFRHRLLGRIPAQCAGRGAGVGGAGAGAQVRPAAGLRRSRAIPWRVRVGIRIGDPPSERCRGDARQGSAPFQFLGRGRRSRRSGERQRQPAAGRAEARHRQAHRVPAGVARGHSPVERRRWRLRRSVHPRSCRRGARCCRRAGVARAGERRVWRCVRWRCGGPGRDRAVTKLSARNRGF